MSPAITATVSHATFHTEQEKISSLFGYIYTQMCVLRVGVFICVQTNKPFHTVTVSNLNLKMFWHKNAKRLVKTLSRASTRERQVITEMQGHVGGGVAFFLRLVMR